MVNNKKLLLITFSFAPSAKVGGKRFSTLSYYLNKQNFDVNVLTVKNKYHTLLDESIKYSGNIYRTNMFPPFPVERKNIANRIFMRVWENITHTLVDPYIGWIVPAILKGYSIIKKNKIDVIIVTGPPFSAFLIGYLLSALLNKKLIIDFRDPWSLHDNNLTKMGKKLSKRIESFLLNYSNAIIFNTCRTAQAYRNEAIDNKIHIIPNGLEINKASIDPSYLDKDKIVLLYAGNFYSGRKLNYLFDPILKLYDNNLIKRGNIAIHVFGKIIDEDIKVIEKLGLEDMVIEHEKVTHDQILSYMKGADILYLPQGDILKYAVAYKFFDYLSVKKPILSISALESAMTDIMDELDCGEKADTSCPSVYNALVKLLVEKKVYSFRGMENYTWDNITQKYIKIISSI